MNIRMYRKLLNNFRILFREEGGGIDNFTLNPEQFWSNDFFSLIRKLSIDYINFMPFFFIKIYFLQLSSHAENINFRHNSVDLISEKVSSFVFEEIVNLYVLLMCIFQMYIMQIYIHNNIT